MLQRFRISAAALLALIPSAWADTVILKSGEKVEGKVIAKTATEITIQVQVTPTIKDERLIKMSEVDKIQEVKPDEEAWVPLKSLAPAEESLEIADYERAAGLLGAFIAQFPQSSHVAEAKEKLAKFEEEKKRVDAGERKLEGKWLTKDQVVQERVQISGRVLFTRMKRHAAAGLFVEAMNTFDALEKTAAGCAVYPDAVELARKVLPSLRAAAEQRLAQVKRQSDDNERRLANAKGAELQQLEVLLRQQTAAIDTAVKSAERSGVKWMPLNPATDRTLNALITRCNSEISGLNRHQVDRMRQSITLAESARAALNAQELPKAEVALRDATSAWSSNELVKRLQPQMVAARRAFIEAKVAEEKAKAEAARATPTPKPKPAVATAEETVAVEPEPAKEEGSPLSKPAFWVILLIVIGFTFAIIKFFRRFSDPSKNILDQ